jgi:hypothetical protein
VQRGSTLRPLNSKASAAFLSQVSDTVAADSM